MKTLKVLLVIAAVYLAAYSLLDRYWDRADWNKTLTKEYNDFNDRTWLSRPEQRNQDER